MSARKLDRSVLQDPPPGVAVQGRRLKRGVSWVTIVAILLMLGFFFVPQFLGVLGFALFH